MVTTREARVAHCGEKMPCHPATSRHVGTGIPGTATEGFSAQGPLCVSFCTCCGATGRGQNQCGGRPVRRLLGQAGPGVLGAGMFQTGRLLVGSRRRPSPEGVGVMACTRRPGQAAGPTHMLDAPRGVWLAGSSSPGLHRGCTGAALGLRPGCGCTGRGQSLPGRETLMAPRQWQAGGLGLRVEGTGLG